MRERVLESCGVALAIELPALALVHFAMLEQAVAAFADSFIKVEERQALTAWLILVLHGGSTGSNGGGRRCVKWQHVRSRWAGESSEGSESGNELARACFHRWISG